MWPQLTSSRDTKKLHAATSVGVDDVSITKTNFDSIDSGKSVTRFDENSSF